MVQVLVLPGLTPVVRVDIKPAMIIVVIVIIIIIILPGLTPAVRVDIKPAKRRCGFFVAARRNVPCGM